MRRKWQANRIIRDKKLMKTRAIHTINKENHRPTKNKKRKERLILLRTEKMMKMKKMRVISEEAIRMQMTALMMTLMNQKRKKGAMKNSICKSTYNGSNKMKRRTEKKEMRMERMMMGISMVLGSFLRMDAGW